MKQNTINKIARAFRIWGYLHYAVAIGVILIAHDIRTALCLMALGVGFTIIGDKTSPILDWILGKNNE